MARLLGKIICVIVNIIMIPIVLILAVPMGILKARKAQKCRVLFTGEEQSLLAKAQRTINMDANALLKPDRDLLEVARCIEDARYDYQTIKSMERFDESFSDFVMSRINQCHVADWENVIGFFEISRFITHESNRESPSVQDLVRALQNYIAGYKNENGFFPKTVMLDHNVHLKFAHAGIYRNVNDYFGHIEIIPVSNIDGGLAWKAVELVPADKLSEDFDDVPF